MNEVNIPEDGENVESTEVNVVEIKEVNTQDSENRMG